MKGKIDCGKIFFGLFSCDALAGIESDLGEASYRLYRTNYIRCARFLMVKKIWEILDIESLEYRIKDACTYIMDFDNYVLWDFNRITKVKYGEKKAVFCWNSDMSKETDFPNSLNCFGIINNKMNFSLSHKVVKAGFAAISPSALTSTMLKMFELYAIWPATSNIHHKLFCFYYGDQMCLLNLLRDIKETDPYIYRMEIGWIDANTSDIACLEVENKPAIYMPKGQTSINEILH